VVGDVDDLVGEQPDVERVQHPSGARHGQVELEVAGAVPAERGNPAVGRHAEGVDGGSKSADPHSPLRDRRARLAASAHAGDQRLVPEQLLGSVQDVGEDQRSVLHQPAHR
jgi:hypothetical protein